MTIPFVQEFRHALKQQCRAFTAWKQLLGQMTNLHLENKRVKPALSLDETTHFYMKIR